MKPWSPLTQAIENSDYRGFRKFLILDSNESIKERNKDGYTAFHFAIATKPGYKRYFDSSFMELLIARKGQSFLNDANNIRRETPLHIACEFGHRCWLKAILNCDDPPVEIDAKDCNGRTPLYRLLFAHDKFHKNRTEDRFLSAATLLDDGASLVDSPDNPQQNSILHLILLQMSSGICRLEAKERFLKAYLSNMRRAQQRNQHPSKDSIVNCFNMLGDTALYLACTGYMEDVSCIELLLECGADPCIAHGTNSLLPIHLLCLNDISAATKILLEYPSAPEFVNQTTTITSKVKLCLYSRFSIPSYDHEIMQNSTALHLACQSITVCSFNLLVGTQVSIFLHHSVFEIVMDRLLCTRHVPNATTNHMMRWSV